MIYNLNNKLVCEIKEERRRQIDKGYGAESDDNKHEENWCNDILAYAHWARQMNRMESPKKYRRRMMQVAALAIAACESYDRAEDEAGLEPAIKGLERYKSSYTNT